VKAYLHSQSVTPEAFLNSFHQSSFDFPEDIDVGSLEARSYFLPHEVYAPTAVGDTIDLRKVDQKSIDAMGTKALTVTVQMVIIEGIRVITRIEIEHNG
jgi:hypothetical protein